jgi:hypothetical protein
LKQSHHLNITVSKVISHLVTISLNVATSILSIFKAFAKAFRKSFGKLSIIEFINSLLSIFTKDSPFSAIADSVDHRTGAIHQCHFIGLPFLS